MVTRWGMSDKVGLVSFGQESSQFLGPEAAEGGSHTYSEATSQLIDEEVHAVVVDAYEQVKQLLMGHRSTLDRIAQELRRHEFLDQQQLLALLKEAGVEVQTLSQPATSDQRESNLLQQPAPMAHV